MPSGSGYVRVMSALASRLPGNVATRPSPFSPWAGAEAAMYTSALTLGWPMAALVMTSPP